MPGALEMVAVVLTLGGLVLMLLGLRGRPADGHPLCRRCRFDLIGSPDVAQCPECGNELARKRAVRVRRRRPALRTILLGAALFLGGVAAAVPPVTERLGEVRWERHKPTWWLVRDTRSTSHERAGLALRELMARTKRNELSDERIRDLAVQGLLYRDDGSPCGLWFWYYGNFLDIAYDRGLLSEEEQADYMRNAFALGLIGPLRRSYPNAPTNPFMSIIVMAYVGEPSRSTLATPPVDFELVEFSVLLDGEPLDTDIQVRRHADPDNSESLGYGWVSSAAVGIELPKDLEGRRLTIRWTLNIVRMGTHELVGEPWSGERTIQLDAPIPLGIRRQDDRPPPNISRY